MVAASLCAGTLLNGIPANNFTRLSHAHALLGEVNRKYYLPPAPSASVVPVQSLAGVHRVYRRDVGLRGPAVDYRLEVVFPELNRLDEMPLPDTRTRESRDITAKAFQVT